MDCSKMSDDVEILLYNEICITTSIMFLTNMWKMKVVCNLLIKYRIILFVYYKICSILLHSLQFYFWLQTCIVLYLIKSSSYLKALGGKEKK